MIQLVPILNKQDIKFWLFHDNLAKSIIQTDDLSSWNPPTERVNYYLLTNEGMNPIGVFILESFNTNAFIFHAGLYKKYRGVNSMHWLREVLNNLKEMFPGKKFFTPIPTSNKPCISLVTKCGLIKKCVLPDASTEGDLILFEVR